jgi:hypothetical protein
MVSQTATANSKLKIWARLFNYDWAKAVLPASHYEAPNHQRIHVVQAKHIYYLGKSYHNSALNKMLERYSNETTFLDKRTRTLEMME